MQPHLITPLRPLPKRQRRQVPLFPSPNGEGRGWPKGRGVRERSTGENKVSDNFLSEKRPLESNRLICFKSVFSNSSSRGVYETFQSISIMHGLNGIFPLRLVRGQGGPATLRFFHCSGFDASFRKTAGDSAAGQENTSKATLTKENRRPVCKTGKAEKAMDVYKQWIERNAKDTRPKGSRIARSVLLCKKTIR